MSVHIIPHCRQVVIYSAVIVRTLVQQLREVDGRYALIETWKPSVLVENNGVVIWNQNVGTTVTRTVPDA